LIQKPKISQKWKIPGAASFSLDHADGRRLFVQSQNLISGENHFSFEVAGLPAGTYFLNLQNASGKMTRKVIIH